MALRFGPKRSPQGSTVRIEGARELRRAFRKIDRELGKQLRDELRDRVAEPVAAKIRSRVPVRTGRWRGKITAGATQSGAHISWGRTYTAGSTRDSSIPYAAPMEFGGYPQGRPFRPEGRYVWPTAKERDPDIERAAIAAYEDVARSAGF